MYALWIASGLLVGLLILACRLGGGSRSYCVSLLTVALSALLGVAAAKLFYVLLITVPTAPADALGAFLYPDADTFSVFGGGAGALAGAWLSARLVKVKPAFLLDQFTPCMALVFRLSPRGGKGAWHHWRRRIRAVRQRLARLSLLHSKHLRRAAIRCVLP